MRTRPRLYLSSYRLGDDAGEPMRFRGVRPGRAAIILNALDGNGSTRARGLEREAADLEALGYRCTELDLRDYFGQPGSLGEALRDADLVWAVGGNAFVLARAMTQSGFVDELPAQLDRGLTYAGYSAGACVAGPDLQGVALMDEPDLVPDGYEREAEASCLDLVSYRIIPHWQSDHPEAADAERARVHLELAGLPNRCLRDGEAIVVAR